METESVLVRILRKSHADASRLEKHVLGKKLTVLQSSFMDPEQFQAMKTPTSRGRGGMLARKKCRP